MDCFTALQKMPRVHKTLDEARIWCELLLGWNYHFRAESAIVGISQEMDTKGLPMAWQGSMDPLMGVTMLHDPKEVPVALFREYKAHTSKMTQWFNAFTPLFSSLQMEPGRDIIGGTVLLVQTKMSLIRLASALLLWRQAMIIPCLNLVSLWLSQIPSPSNFPRNWPFVQMHNLYIISIVVSSHHCFSLPQNAETGLHVGRLLCFCIRHRLGRVYLTASAVGRWLIRL